MHRKEQDQAERLLLGSGLLHTGKAFPVTEDLLRGMILLVKKYPELAVAYSTDEGDDRHWVGRLDHLVTVGNYRRHPPE